jgi:ABC-2 type transport system permease protein
MTALAALVQASYRSYFRDRVTLFFTFAFPLLFLVVFGLIFGGRAVAGTSRSYIDYIAPGVLGWGVANAALFGAAFTVMQWRRDDVLRLIRMSPVPLGTVVGSRYIVAVVVGLLQTVLFLGVAVLPGFDLALAGTWPASLPVLLLGITSFLFIGVVIGNFTKTPEAVAAVANFIMVPMAFLSGSFLPIDTMPGWLRAASRALPLRYLNDGLAAGLGGTGGHPVAVACGGLAVFAAIAGAVALRTFRWSNQR